MINRDNVIYISAWHMDLSKYLNSFFHHLDSIISPTSIEPYLIPMLSVKWLTGKREFQYGTVLFQSCIQFQHPYPALNSSTASNEYLKRLFRLALVPTKSEIRIVSVKIVAMAMAATGSGRCTVGFRHSRVTASWTVDRVLCAAIFARSAISIPTSTILP